jgi:hypothetical protein
MSKEACPKCERKIDFCICETYSAAIASTIDGVFVIPTAAYCCNLVYWHKNGTWLDDNELLIIELMLHGY